LLLPRSPRKGECRRREGQRAAEFRLVSGPALGRLLKEDGWKPGRIATHGQVYTKTVNDTTLVTVLPLRTDLLPEETLAAILGPKQTRLGKAGLRRLIEKYGL